MKKIVFFIKNTRGSMDSILVTLLLVVIGVALLIGLFTFFEEQQEELKTHGTEQNARVIQEVTQ
jgi:hypothetical protein